MRLKRASNKHVKVFEIDRIFCSKITPNIKQMGATCNPTPRELSEETVLRAVMRT